MQLKSQRKERGGVSGGQWSGGRGCFIGLFSVGSASLKKFQTSWLAKRCLVLPIRRPTSLNSNTVYVHTRSNVHAVVVCFRNPLNYDMDYRILMCLYNLLMHVYIHTCLPLFIQIVLFANSFLQPGWQQVGQQICFCWSWSWKPDIWEKMVRSLGTI